MKRVFETAEKICKAREPNERLWRGTESKNSWSYGIIAAIVAWYIQLNIKGTVTSISFITCVLVFVMLKA